MIAQPLGGYQHRQHAGTSMRSDPQLSVDGAPVELHRRNIRKCTHSRS